MRKLDIKPLEQINTLDELKERINKIKSIVEEVNREKKNIKSHLGKLTRILKEVGIK